MLDPVGLNVTRLTLSTSFPSNGGFQTYSPSPAAISLIRSSSSASGLKIVRSASSGSDRIIDSSTMMWRYRFRISAATSSGAGLPAPPSMEICL